MDKIQFIHLAVCKYFNLNLEEIFSKTRERYIVERRQIFFYLCRKLTKFSQQKIGSYSKPIYGVKWDHATVRHAEKTIGDLIIYDRELDSQINTIKEIVYGLDVEETLNFPNIKDTVVRITINSKNKKELINDLKKYLKTA